ncbi:MAG: hypothetical protein JXR73_20170 [Candidatus Omnitrophica bacterium]|nr:hypothetical protein [Candidatus Omnitrophota bacterium]
MSHLLLFDIGAKVVAKTHLGPLPGHTIFPGMKGEVIDRDEIIRRHKIQFENNREVWATSDQVKLDPDYAAGEKTSSPGEESADQDKPTKSNSKSNAK